MKPIGYVLLVLLTGSVVWALEPKNMTVESMNNPAGIDTPSPRLSWEYDDSNGGGARQSAYQILVASDRETLDADQGDLWDSGKVVSSQQLFVPYAGKPLPGSQVCFAKVRVWDEPGNVSRWSEPLRWVMGVMRPADWKAKWIAMPASLRPEANLDGAFWIGTDGQNAEFSKKFMVPEGKSYVEFALAADREYELFVNGQKCGHSSGHVFSPEVLRFYDVTPFVKAGENEAVVKVKHQKDQKAALLARIAISALDDTSFPAKRTPGAVIFSDKTWQAKDASVKELFGPDAGPWGKVLRRTELASPAFQKKFTLEHPENVTSVVVHLTAAGYFHAMFNGKRLSTPLAPAPTRFDRRVLYLTYPIEDVIQRENTFSVLVGHGWYDMRTVSTWNFDAAPWRDFPRMLAQLEITYKDGTKETIVSDDSWDAIRSPILYDCIRQGVIFDGNVPMEEPELLGKAEIVDAPQGKLVAQRCPETTLYPFPLDHSVQEVYAGNGVKVFDVRQNMAGIGVIGVKNPQKGDRIRVRYGERVLPDGSLERHNIDCFFMEGSPSWYVGKKGEFQTDWYLVGEGSPQTFLTLFTYHGFQYAEVTCFRGDRVVNDFDCQFFPIPINTAFPQVGVLEMSNPLLNAIQSATNWSYRGNFVNGYPTDCPHREKNGWTGDAALAVEQAQYNWENTAAYRKWLDDLRDEQQPDGNLPGIVPSGGWGYQWGNGPAWDSALLILPWTIYCYRGDRGILEENYDAMKRYVDYLTTRATPDGIVTHGLSDWCPAKTRTAATITSTGYYYYDTNIVAQAAKILGKDDDAKKYAALAKKIRDDANRVLYKGNGVYDNGSQCAQSCAIHQGLADGLPPEEKAKVFARLVEAVEKENRHLDVGILGMKYLLRTLSEGGRTDLALAIMLQETQPCYADWLCRGGNTLWEDFGDGSSRNHIMYGDISAWFWQYLAGIQLEGGVKFVAAADAGTPGFQRFVIAPRCARKDISPAGFEPLRKVKGEYASPYGKIVSQWEWNHDLTRLVMQIDVPPNTTARIVLPLEEGDRVTVGQGNLKEISRGVYEAVPGKYLLIIF
ncbi:MAG: family 78 glycoside hydrolase catalytic domain [Planctomycetia bacterium]|nr:family 78 glycoside hydrolase catalytic domain [Planctomycetia bacterium]